MENSIYLFAAFSMAWTVIFIYIFRLFRSQKVLGSQIDKIKNALQKNIEPDSTHP